MAAVPNLQEKQAERLLRNSYLDNKSHQEAHVSLVETHKIVREMTLEQKNLKEHINFIDKVVSFVADCVRPQGATSTGEDIPPWAQDYVCSSSELERIFPIFVLFLTFF